MQRKRKRSKIAVSANIKYRVQLERVTIIRVSHMTVHSPESPLVHQLRKEALEPVSSCAAGPGTATKFPLKLPRGAGSRTAQGFWHWSSMSSLPSCRLCYLLLPAAIKISSVINYLQTFWSKNSFSTLSLTLKFTLSDLCYLLFFCPTKNLKVLFLLIARDLVAI